MSYAIVERDVIRAVGFDIVCPCDPQILSEQDWLMAYRLVWIKPCGLVSDKKQKQ